MLRIAIIIISAIILMVLQVSLPTTINLVLTVSLFILFVSRFADALWLALISGFLLELYALTPFGMILASLLLTLIVTNLLFTYFFTNRSLPALLALGFAGTLIFRFIFFVLNLVLMIKLQINFSFTFRDYILITLWEMISNTLLLLMAFILMNRFSQRLKAVFLMR